MPCWCFTLLLVRRLDCRLQTGRGRETGVINTVCAEEETEAQEGNSACPPPHHQWHTQLGTWIPALNLPVHHATNCEDALLGLQP